MIRICRIEPDGFMWRDCINQKNKPVVLNPGELL